MRERETKDHYYFVLIFFFFKKEIDCKQRHVTSKMRAVLLDWLFEVMLEYRLCDKTLQLAALYVDRYLCVTPSLPKSSLQLLGVAAMLVASKFEDVRSVDLASLIWISDEAYSADEVRAMEQRLLCALGWDVAAVTAVVWVDALVASSGLAESDAALLGHMATFLTHLMAQHWPTSRGLLPSHHACAALFYAGLAQGLISEWPETLFAPLRISRTDPDLLRCLRHLHSLYRSLPTLELHRALRSKYSHFSHFSVALTPPIVNPPF